MLSFLLLYSPKFPRLKTRRMMWPTDVQPQQQKTQFLVPAAIQGKGNCCHAEISQTYNTTNYDIKGRQNYKSPMVDLRFILRAIFLFKFINFIGFSESKSYFDILFLAFQNTFVLFEHLSCHFILKFLTRQTNICVNNYNCAVE